MHVLQVDEDRHLDDAFEIPRYWWELAKDRHIISRSPCQANERDTETLSGILRNGWGILYDEIKQGNIVLLNTCAIRETAERKVFW